MLYVIGFIASPVALFLVRRPLQAVIALACYILAWIGVLIGVIPGMILYFYPIFILWFGLFWFIPTAYTIAVIKAQAAGKVRLEWVDCSFALSRLSITLLLIIVSLVAGYTSFWLYTAHRFRERLDTWAKTQDYAVRWDSALLEGFPFDMRLRLRTTFGETKLLVTIDAAPWDPTLVSCTAQNVTGSETLGFWQVWLPDAPSSNPQEDFLGLRRHRLRDAP